MKRNIRNAARVTRGLLALLVFAVTAAPVSSFQLDRIATGLDEPVFVTAPPADATRVFIIEQMTGLIKILELGTQTVRTQPFLAVPLPASVGGEQGLLGLAFHPNYASNGFFYVYYTNPGTQVVRYTVTADPDVADPASAFPILSFAQPQGNHNAGWIGFGPNDGLLYIASGDGGGGHDTGTGHDPIVGNAQDIDNNLLGKILRVDVDTDDFPADGARNYGIPAGNPFVNVTGDDEIWAYGLRNPFRSSFDRLTGDLYIGDVGQGSCEEVNVNPGANPVAGANYGWRLREGVVATPDGGVGGPKPPGAIDPVMDYSHGGGVTCSNPGSPFFGFSVIGGIAYRGPISELRGRYFFTDHFALGVWSFLWDGSAPALHDGTNYTDLISHDSDPRFTPSAGTVTGVTSFGEDANANLYLSTISGDIFLVPEPRVVLSHAVALCVTLLVARSRRRSRVRPASTPMERDRDAH